MSVNGYFDHTKNFDNSRKTIIPNFIGISGNPVYPVTESYARHTIIVHTAWREYPTNRNWISEFNDFINSEECPKSCRMAYDRAVQRFTKNLTHYEPTSAKADHTMNEVLEEDRNLLELVGLPSTEEYDEDRHILESMDHGLKHKWDEPPLVSSFVGNRSDFKLQQNLSDIICRITVVKTYIEAQPCRATS